MEMKVKLKSGLAAIEDTGFLNQCVELYSNHYGIWSAKGIHPNEQIKLSNERIVKWLEKEKTNIYYTKHEGTLIGYAIVCRKNISGFGVISWVTQLVVHTDYRNQGIAKNLLYSIWCMSNDKAWGIVSSNPYAIRALEKATRRRTDPLRIKKNHRKLLNISSEFTPYIKPGTEIEINSETSQINTEFYVDHYLVDTKTKIVYRKEQFTPENDIPVEYVVMDKRYSMDEIVSICENNHLKVIEKKYVNASNWENSLNSNDKKAKEILLLCEKVLK